MSTSTRQLPLAIEWPALARFDTYIDTAALEVVAALERVGAGTQKLPVYLWGEAGVGKTHLLHATCAAAAGYGRRALYLSMPQAREHYDAAMLEGLDEVDVVCIDDIGAAAGASVWEEALLHLYNRRHDLRLGLVLTDRLGPTQTGIALPDLRSRLAWGLSYRVVALDDAGKRAALAARAVRYGLELPEPVAQLLLTHCPRDLTRLFAVLEDLDRAALAAQRRLTVPFVRQFLGL